MFDLSSPSRPRLVTSLLGGALALSATMLLPSSAAACGGTFCDSGPTAMPVDQTGENILFHLGENSVEAHIQVQYDPDSGAEQFAWVIPVTAIPEFEVGSQLLFDAMLQASVPSYGMQVSNDFCGEGFGGALTGSGGDDGGGAPNGDGDDEAGGDDPAVVLQATVGAFEISVLEGGTVEGVMTWLSDNGYQQDPAAEPILAQYLEEEFLFVAMKLSTRAGVDEIHPIVVRYEGDEPCVPIRLTRIAAVDDMEIRTFFLQDARVVPTNFRHVLINPLKLDWPNNASNYKEVISMAVDADEANGNAFVTEYAGTSDVIQTWMIDQGWSSAPFANFVDSPVGVIQELSNQGLIFCDADWGTECTYLHPLVESIVSQFIPVPEALAANEFYNCLECYVDQIDLTAWSATGFSMRLDERIIEPAQRAVALIEANPYLTRMYTTISPNEMMADPIFKLNNTLADVSNINFATQTNHCSGGATITLPDGREVMFPDATDITWPDFGAEMPWEEEVDQENMADNAPLINLVDNTEQINDLLEQYNKEADLPGADVDAEAGGCVCSVDEGGEGRGGLAFGFATLALFGLVRRRRA